MSIKEKLQAQVGKRVRFLGSMEPDPDLQTGQEGTALAVTPDDKLLVEWDRGPRLSLTPAYDSWELIPEGDPMKQAAPTTLKVERHDFGQEVRANRFSLLVGHLIFLDSHQRMGERLSEIIARLQEKKHRGDASPLTEEEQAIIQLWTWLSSSLTFVNASLGAMPGDLPAMDCPQEGGQVTEEEGQLWKARAEALLPIAVAAKNLYHNARWPWTIQMPVGVLIDETRLETLGEALAHYEAMGKKENE